MEGTDISTGQKANFTEDRTYYGNSCSNTWKNEPPYYGGSTVACSIRIVETRDNEYQNIGTYYHFQAASSGSGAAVTTENAIIPDSFCPLGWQLPYGGTSGDYYDKSRSFRYLFSRYGTYVDSFGLETLSYPFSYNPNGSYSWGTISVMQATRTGHYWSSNVSSQRAFRLHISGNTTEGLLDKNGGVAIRYVSGLAT